MKRLLVLILAMPQLAGADPSGASRYLLNEPASLMDISIMRLNIGLGQLSDKLLDQFSRSAGVEGTSLVAIASYQLTPDFVVVDVAVSDWDFVLQDNDQRKQGCRTVTNILLGWVSARVDSDFQHEGVARVDQPDTLIDELKERIKIRCRVYEGLGHVGSEHFTVSVEKMLRGDEFSISEQDTSR